MFQERQEIFEFDKERDADWKYPKYVKIEKNKRYKKQDIDNYNELNVFKQNIRFDAVNNIYDDDDQQFRNRNN